MENDKKVTSCIMLACDLQTPVSLATVFEAEDLKDTGIEFESHITILYARDRFIDKTDVMFDSPESLNSELVNLKSDGEVYPVFDLFELGNFENDSGYVVLKLKEDTWWFKVLSEFNEKLLTKYGIEPTFKNYTPHLTLAEIQPGLTQKYVDLDQLRLILEASTVRPEDLIISYDAGDKDYKVHNITYNNTVDRFFRIRDLRREAEEIYRGE